MPQQISFVGAQKPQQKSNSQNATATRQQPEATSSWPNIPQRNPPHIPQHIPQHKPQQRAFLGAQEPQHRSNNQKASMDPESNKKACRCWQNIPDHILQHIKRALVGAQEPEHTYATATSTRRNTRARANSTQPESYRVQRESSQQLAQYPSTSQKATRKQPESNQQLAKYSTTYSISYSTVYSTTYATANVARSMTIATAKSKQR
jgi:hypothetical protein